MWTEEGTEEWRRLHKRGRYYLYSSQNKIIAIKVRRTRWVQHVARTGERDVRRGLRWGIPEGKRALGRPTGRREDNIKMYLQEAGWGMDVIYLTSGYKQVANCYDYGNELSGSENGGEFFD
jgi:hypothetical protein